jgi:glycogen debranching enzyme
VDLRDRAQAVLEGNWLGDATRPGPRLYPHQWSWDSAFNAIGWAFVDWPRATAELRTLFDAQWPSGLLPHIVFHDADADYFPGPTVWDTPQRAGAPQTSGIVQPPVHATAAWLVAQHAPSATERDAFLRDVFEPLSAWHAYLYRERDPDGEGLAAIRHPWESGEDDSPAWDPALAAIPLDPAGVSPYRRVDLTLVRADERPDPTDYDHYVALIECFKRERYDEAAMRRDCPFWVVDPLFNSALACGGEDLARIAEALGEDPAPFQQQAASTTAALNDRLWDDELGLYIAYDRLRERPLPAPVAACFMPLLTAAPSPDQVDAMLETLTSPRFWPPRERGRGVTSYDRLAPGFSRRQYWRGPVWCNVNWLLHRGLLRHGRDAQAWRLAEETLALVRHAGFWEYFHPETGEGLGSEEFSWTAALTLDLLATHNNL